METAKDKERLYQLWFFFATGGKKAAARSLYKKLGSAEKIYHSSFDELTALGVKSDFASILADKDLSGAEKELWFAEQYNARFITPEDADYPSALRDIPNFPLFLYLRGKHFSPGNELCISVIGTKNCSNIGEDKAYVLGRELALSGVTLVSGMSPGIETAALEGCLSAGGKAVAVLVTGVNRVYPKENSSLLQEVMARGSVISEYPLDSGVYPGSFEERNRIISGLCDGVVVVEAPSGSNSLKIAHVAKKLGRRIFAFSPEISNPLSEGPLELVDDGADCIGSTAEIIEKFSGAYPSAHPITSQKKEIPADMNLTPAEAEILSSLTESPKTAEELSTALGKNISEINGTLIIMELTDKIRLSAFGKYEIK